MNSPDKKKTCMNSYRPVIVVKLLLVDFIDDLDFVFPILHQAERDD